MTDAEMNKKKISGYRSDGSYRMYPNRDACMQCFGHRVLKMTCKKCKGTGLEIEGNSK